jgi:hypothetical protein
MSTDKVYFVCGGGFGDCLGHWMTGELSYAPAVKAASPTTRIHVLCFSSSTSILEVLEGNPAFDSAEVVSCLGDAPAAARRRLEADGCVHWGSAFDQRALRIAFPRVHLAAGEEDQVREIVTGGPFVVFHPFNSAGTGMAATHFDTNVDCRRIAKLAQEAGYRVVQVGGDWTHVPTYNRLREGLNLNLPDVIDLTNRVSARVTLAVAMAADKFIGSSSAWWVASVYSGVPSFVVLPSHMRDYVADEAATGQGLRGTLIRKYGSRWGVAGEELYHNVAAFFHDPLPRKTPVLTEAGLELT